MTAATQPPSDPAAVHRGLLAIARERQADFNAILAQYAIERLIDRLARSPEYGDVDEKQRQWNAYLTRMRIGDMPTSLPEVVGAVRRFVLPALHAAAGAGTTPGQWNPGSGWSGFSE